MCDIAGLDTSANSIPYMTSWSAKASLDVLQQTAELVDRLTREIEAPVVAVLDRDSRSVEDEDEDAVAGRELETA